MVETQETLTQRFNALQEEILNIIEEGPTDLQSIIKFWQLSRKENVILYYARKENYTTLGLQPVPALAVSEYKAKEAIQIQLLVTSLSKSAYAAETWTLQDCSAELLNTQPKNCFKKAGYSVDVWFDHDKDKAFPYTNWKYIYYQDASDEWHKVNGKVDANGLYYDEINGDRVYFTLFEADSAKYGLTGEWTVHYENTTVVSSSSSNRRIGQSQKSVDSTSSRDSSTPSPKRRRITQEADSATPSTSTDSAATVSLRAGGRRQQRKPTSTLPKRRRTRSPERSAAPTPSEVGTGHRLPPRQGLGRLQRLQAEAWDPYLLILKGPSNNLKCWRNKVKLQNWFRDSSNVWRWLGPETTQSRMLLAFDSTIQRERFLLHVKLPKNTTFAYGSLDSL